MTADPGYLPVRRRSFATARPEPAEVSPTREPVERRLPTARECGRISAVDTTDGTRCRDFTPGLIIELI